MLLSTVITELCGGMITSIEIFLLTLLFSLPLGLVVAWGRMSKFKPLRWLMKVYISIMRGTPLMLQLIVVFFAPYYIFGASLSPDYRMISVIIAFLIMQHTLLKFTEAELKLFLKDNMKLHRY